MLYPYHDLMLKSIVQDVAEQYRREAAAERLAHQVRSATSTPAARKRGKLFTVLGRRWGHAASA